MSEAVEEAEERTRTARAKIWADESIPIEQAAPSIEHLPDDEALAGIVRRVERVVRCKFGKPYADGGTSSLVYLNGPIGGNGSNPVDKTLLDAFAGVAR